MALLKKNLWLAFYLTAFIWCAFFGTATYITYHTIYNEYTAERKKLLSLTSNSIKAMFRQYEVLLDVIAREITLNDGLPNRKIAQHTLNTVIDVDHSMLGVGIFMPDGSMYVASSEVKMPAKFNLLSQTENKDSFRQTLQEHRMVLGRTYQSHILKTIAFPLRKAVRDKTGKVLFILSTVIDLDKGFQSFIRDKYHQDDSPFYLYRERDHYFQLVVSKHPINPSIYNTPIPAAAVDAVRKVMNTQIGVPYDTIKHFEMEVIVPSHQPGSKEMAVTKYIDPYGLWIELALDQNVIMTHFFSKVKILSLTFIGSLALVFSFFRTIALSEQRKNQALYYQASHDSLTGLHNRFFLDQTLIQDEKKAPYCLIFIDLDNFKAINDGYGHECGDKVLCEIATRLQSLVQDDDLLIRYSGDEFIIVTDAHDEQIIHASSQRMLSVLNQPCHIGAHHFILSASIGIAIYPQHGHGLEELKRHADLAMYESKKNRNTVTIFQDNYQRAYQTRAHIEQASNMPSKKMSFT